jgi:hypothetical protein
VWITKESSRKFDCGAVEKPVRSGPTYMESLRPGKPVPLCDGMNVVECGIAIVNARFGSGVESSRQYSRPSRTAPRFPCSMQCKTNTFRCQSITGFWLSPLQTSASPDQNRDNRTHKSRSQRLRCRRGGAFAWSTASWWASRN